MRFILSLILSMLFQGAAFATLTNGVIPVTKNGSSNPPTLQNSNVSVSANGNIIQKINTIASSATPSINTDTTDEFTITALATAITSFTTNLTGTPANGQKLIIIILDNGTPQSITWGASFVQRGQTLPITTVSGKYLYVGFIYNSTTSTWDCVSTAQEI